MKTGARAGRKAGKQYDLVFQDQIEFVTNEVLAGAARGRVSCARSAGSACRAASRDLIKVQPFVHAIIHTILG
jgi:hypothetical protein